MSAIRHRGASRAVTNPRSTPARGEGADTAAPHMLPGRLWVALLVSAQDARNLAQNGK
jgi:hypothetical protein